MCNGLRAQGKVAPAMDAVIRIAYYAFVMLDGLGPIANNLQV